MTEKAAVVKLNSDGEVVQCAKGAAPAECGYVPGAKVCGKCGAMAVSMKVDAPSVSVKQLKKKKMTGMMAIDADLDEELEMEVEDDDMDEEGMELVDDEEMDDDMDEEEMDDDEDMESDEKMYGVEEEDDDMYVRRAAPKKKKKPVMNMMSDEDMEKDMHEGDEDEEDLYASEAATRNKMRRRRLSSMGFKSEDFDDQAFVCAFDKKVYPGAASVCDSCVGGCVAEKGMPALIEIEGMAEDMFRGKILDSGYSDEADLFIVDVERKDGKPVEVFFDGSTGEMMGCFGLTEPNHGSNPSGMTTNYKDAGDHVILNGAKMWISNSPFADIAVVWAKNEEGKIKGIIVERGMEGFTTPETHNKWSLRASATGELVFDNVKVPKENILPNVEGLKGPLGCLNQARYGIAWGAIGAAMDCYDTALRYSKERIQFDRPIGGFQLQQKKLAEMLTEITKAQLLVWRLGQLMDKGLATPAQISMAKRNNVEIAINVAKEARQMLGGMGISGDYSIMRHSMNLESVITYEGTHDIHLLITGLDITGLNAFK